MTQPGRVYHLALREWHAAAGATFAVHGSWSLPEHYGDPAAEHRALREAAAVADLSHHSRFLVTGTDAAEVLGSAFAGHFEELEEARALRTAALDEAGRIRDVALIARTGGIAYLAAGEPGQREETLERLRSATGRDFDVRVDDRTESTCWLALAGPRAGEVIEQHLQEGLAPRLQRMQAAAFEFHGFRALAVRTSDVGEDGFLFMVAPAVAQHMLETLREAGVALAGRAAWDCARLEACIPAFDPDLAAGLTPAEADLDVVLGLPGGAEGRILSAVLIEGDAPLPPGTLVRHEGTPVGELRSCAWSFGLRSVIGLAIVASRVALPGTALDLNGVPATIVAKPFLRRRT